MLKIYPVWQMTEVGADCCTEGNAGCSPVAGLAAQAVWSQEPLQGGNAAPLP